ncbi:MAG: lipoyl(octanoyl) transferase LipB, partial [Bacteroidota bacterium]
MPNQVIFNDLGNIPYLEAWDYQKRLSAQTLDVKRRNRDYTPEHENWQTPPHHLLFCDHPPVYTLGKSGSEENLLLSQEALKQQGFEFYKINRGGDVTYHGPGQIIAYPIFDLEQFFKDVHRYARTLEEVVIRMLAEYGIIAGREKGYTGVWL